MSFRANTEQQLTLGDSALALTERERKALEGSWAKVFGDEVFPAIDEERFSVPYSDKASRPNTPVNVVVGALAVKEPCGHADDELVEALMFDVRLQYALHTTSFEEQPLSDKTLSRFRRRHGLGRETGEDLWRDCVKGLAEKTAEIMGIDGRVRGTGSVTVESNIRTPGRSEIACECLANARGRLRRHSATGRRRSSRPTQTETTSTESSTTTATRPRGSGSPRSSPTPRRWWRGTPRTSPAPRSWRSSCAAPADRPWSRTERAACATGGTG